MKAILILNPAAGSLNGERDAVRGEDLVKTLGAAGISVAIREAASRELRRTLDDAVAEKPDAIFVGGGDGTISTAAGCLAGTGIALGVLPLGTLNHFACDLGMPSNWRDAVHALTRGTRRAVDVGEVNGRVFINNCSIGSYPEAVRRRESLRASRGHGKWWAMTVATTEVLRRLKRLRLSIEVEGRARSVRSPFVVVANNRYSARALDYSLRPRLDEGRLWIYTTRARRPLTILRQMWQSLHRAIDAVDGLDSLAADEATIANERGRPLPVAVDGELIDLNAPLRFRIRPRALQVLAPGKKAAA
jgi:diacylglycerol kinase family enzyme